MGAEDIAAEGQKAAVNYLEERGIAVLDQDWNSPDGPIPIVAEERGVLVVVEVATGSRGRYRPTLEQTVSRRRCRLRRAAVRWLTEHGKRYDEIRVDVIGLLRQGDGQFTVEHIRAVG